MDGNEMTAWVSGKGTRVVIKREKLERKLVDKGGERQKKKKKTIKHM